MGLTSDLAKGVAVALLAGGIVHGAHAWADREQPDIVDMAVDRLVTEEGYRESAYTDTTGHQTIGYGFNIDAGISEYAAKALARAQVEERLEALSAAWEPFDDQPDNVKIALLDMSFELGVAGLLRFDDFLGFIADGEYDKAADDLDATKYASQVSERERSVSDLIRGAE